MAAVFLMQPLGQCFAAVVGWCVLIGIGRSKHLQTIHCDPNNTDSTECQYLKTHMDVIWRCIIGVGAFPALIAIIFRLSIPESPRYTMDVDNDGRRALGDTLRHYNEQSRSTMTPTQRNTHIIEDAENGIELTKLQPVVNHRVSHSLNGITAANNTETKEHGRINHFTKDKLKQFFWIEGNWQYRKFFKWYD